MKKPKQKLKPSWEIYSRILWDPELDQQAFYIGYEDRMLEEGLREKRLLDWEDSDVPWNRVQYIRCGDTIVWDRRDRTDLFASAQLPTSAYLQKNNAQLQIEGKPIRPQAVCTVHNQQKWTGEFPMLDIQQLKLLSYNVLTNKYEQVLVQTAKRVPQLLRLLTNSEADVLLLQEVDRSFLDVLLEEEAFQAWYYSISQPEENFYQEQLILSRYPFEAKVLEYSQAKRFPIGKWNINGTHWQIANVHLTSNKAQASEIQRKQQLRTLLNYLETQQGAQVIAGDFNCREEQELTWLTDKQWVDVWEELQPGKPGHTFDPEQNYLASQLSLSKQPARFDRIYLHAANWEAQSVELLGKEAINSELFPSDHYAVLSQLQMVEAVELPESKWTWIKPTYRSGIVIIPPRSLWPALQAIRQKYDAKAYRWMPHITLLYGFVPDRYFKEVAEELSQLLKELNFFEVMLSEYGFFSHASKVTAWLKPEAQPANSLQKLQAALLPLFPASNGKLKKLKQFNPHITVGQFLSEELAREALPEWDTMSFEVTQLFLISRQQDQPFECRYAVELGTGNIEQLEENRQADHAIIELVEKHFPSLSVVEQEARQLAFSLLQEACREVLGFAVDLEPVGSARLKTHQAGSDLDVLCLIPQGLDSLDFFKSVQQKLEGYATDIRIVSDALVPLLKLKIGGVELDLLAAGHPDFPAKLISIRFQDHFKFDSSSWQALTAVLEADQLLKIAKSVISEDTFRWYIRAIRCWAAKHGLKGNSFGYLGSYSWTVLGLWALQRLPAGEDVEALDVLLANFFAQLAAHPWPQAISLVEAGKVKLHPQQDRLPILTTIVPQYNSARNITQSTTHWIQQALQQASTQVEKIQHGKASWATLFEYPQREFPFSLSITITTENENQLPAVCGWLEGNLVGWFIRWEQDLNALLCPSNHIDKQGTTASYVVGVEIEESQQNLLEKSMHDMKRQLNQELKAVQFSWKWGT